jgi:hypothetical protein
MATKKTRVVMRCRLVGAALGRVAVPLAPARNQPENASQSVSYNTNRHPFKIAVTFFLQFIDALIAVLGASFFTV